MPQKARRKATLEQIIRTARYAIDEKLSAEIPKVLDFLLKAVDNNAFEPKDRIAAAKFLLEYFMPKAKTPLVQVNQDNRSVTIKHTSHLGIPTVEAEIPESFPEPPRRQLVDVTEVDAADMVPEEHDRFEPVPADQLPPTDISRVPVANEPLEAPVEIAPLLSAEQPAWRKRFW